MTRIMLMGDTHGNTQFAVNIVKRARKLGVKHVFVLGDFGLWDHEEGGFAFLDTLNEALRKEGVKLFAVPGNHENHDHWEWYIKNNPKRLDGWTYLRSHIFIAPKVHYFQWNHKKFLVVGGAVSIDWQWRLNVEATRGKPRSLYWDNETLTDDDMAKITTQKVDIMLTHDCSNRTPWKTRLKVDADSHDHRRKIDEALRRARPEIHFHGHMHERYEWENLVADDHWTSTYGLERDGMWYSWGVLDLETDKFVWHPLNAEELAEEEADEKALAEFLGEIEKE